jgi:hypothetical protein
MTSFSDPKILAIDCKQKVAFLIWFAPFAQPSRCRRTWIKSRLVVFTNFGNYRYNSDLKRWWPLAGFSMIYKGVEFTVTPVDPGIWKWQFLIGDKVVAGKTEARLNLLAIRRVQLRIDRELKKAEQK